MRAAQLYYNDQLAGILSETGDRFRFVYDKVYLTRVGSRPVSLTMPLREAAYESELFFPAFVNLMSEGVNRAMQMKVLDIDEHDWFGFFLATANCDRIGPLRLKQIHGYTGY